ncbi:MAG: hypothetical protein ACRCZB_05030 [Bacteroidales bacterium]
MPRKISNEWTLKKLLQNTYAHDFSKTRYDYKIRDLVKAIRIEKVSVYDGKKLGEARTKFVVITRSTPQYAPYFTKKDSRGRPRTRQYRYKHEYQVTLQLDTLSLDVPFKGRVGAIGNWDFSNSGKSKKLKTGAIIEGTNIKRGLNGDFFFRCSYLWSKEGILFGRNYALTPPLSLNPDSIVFAPKHFLAVVQLLMERGILK